MPFSRSGVTEGTPISASCGMRNGATHMNRWYRCTQPPAIRWESFGFIALIPEFSHQLQLLRSRGSSCATARHDEAHARRRCGLVCALWKMNVILMHNISMAKAKRQSAIRLLALWFDEHGWTQSPPDPELRKNLKEAYKRGCELRLSARPDEFAKLQRLLIRAGYKAGKQFPKGQRLVVPLYGKEQVQNFLKRIRRVSGRRSARGGSGRASRG